MNGGKRIPLEILLFDMDGVLLVPAGYHKALQETVRRVGHALGYKEAEVSPAAIAEFEAAGATSEWDSSAMCAALLLMRLWESDPESTLSSDLLERPKPGHRLPVPDFLSFAEQLAAAGSANSPPLIRAEKLLIHDGPPRPPGQQSRRPTGSHHRRGRAKYRQQRPDEG